MKVFKTPESFIQWRNGLDFHQTVGFVPTMGSLHDGHLELARESSKENDLTVVSIYVNPTQFNQKNDFDKYPRDLNHDLDLLKQVSSKIVVFAPYDLYAEFPEYYVDEKVFSKKLCGQNRPGHFSGVLTVLTKFFNLTRPSRVYFGEKDYQQSRLVENYIKAMFLPIEFRQVPTFREPSGLAMSSRNKRLSSVGMEVANQYARIFHSPRPLACIRDDLEKLELQIDYLEEIDGRKFVAVVIEGVRLIDNAPISEITERAESEVYSL